MDKTRGSRRHNIDPRPEGSHSSVDLAVRRGLSEVERLAHSRRVWQRVVGLPCYQRARMVLGYMAFDGEVLTDGLIRQATASGKQMVLPMVLA